MAVLSGIVSGGTQDGQAVGFRVNPQYHQLVAAGTSPYFEQSRLGNRWSVQDTSAIAAVVVRPSTVAGLTLFNNEPVGGKSYVIDSIMAFNLVQTAAISGYSIWCCIHPVGMTKPTADITAIKSSSGKSGYGGNAVVDTGATVVDDGWFPVGITALTGGVGTTAPSGALTYQPEGRFIVPPTAAISMNVVASIVGLTFTHGFSWVEQQLVVNP